MTSSSLRGRRLLIRSSDTDIKVKLRVFGLSFLAVGFLYYWLIDNDMFTQIWKVVWTNFPIWVAWAAAALFGLFWYKRHENFSKQELGFFMVLVPFFVFPVVGHTYYWTTNLSDTEIINGAAMSFEYTEEYPVTTKDDDGDESTTWYGPYYYLKTNTSIASVITADHSAWEAFCALWGKSRVTSRPNLEADNSLLYRIYTVTYDGNQEHWVPTCAEHPYVNYFKAAGGLLKTKGVAHNYAKWLSSYPRVKTGRYGPIELNRVIQAGVQLPAPFTQQVEATLDRALRTLGHARQCNVLVYVAGTADAGFFHALQEHWVHGKKNDVVVVIGSQNGTTMDWVEVMAWTKNSDFKGLLKNSVLNLKTLDNGEKLAQTILDQICAEGSAGFERMPMAHYEYLISSITMPWWSWIPLLFVAFIALWPAIWLCLHD